MADNGYSGGNVRAERLDVTRETAKMLYLAKGSYKRVSWGLAQINKDDPRLFATEADALDALAVRLTGEESRCLDKYRRVRADRERAEKLARMAHEAEESRDA